ncbi:hypothetical protein [Rubinisphaera margarita]|uniref:hypothetical protein n=1 Tax=Rubinisphaera margarita TaxID=2909586 RepID=UPI001EE96B6A|nr:hypothetical protein [Rubinisphaera margarita]MCG6154319.1 hypothetical protein [Rubinisphaera margarita]
MSANRHIHLRPDQLHVECVVRAKGIPATKRLKVKLLRNGITEFHDELAPVGRPYRDFHITAKTRASYSRLMGIVGSTEDTELIT